MDGFDWRNPDYDLVYKHRINMLQRMRAPGYDFQALWEYYSINADDFINDFGMTFDPRNAEIGLPTVIPFILFPKQRDFVNWVLDRWEAREDGLAEKSRDMGVSWLCSAIAAWMWIFKKGTVAGFGSRKESYVDDTKNPNSLFWKIRSFISYLPPEFKPEGYDEKKHATFMNIINPVNGAAIIGEAGDNIGRGGRTSIYFKDESAFYERPEIIDAALSQTSNCKLDISTPNGTGNPFYRKRHSGKVSVFVFDWRDDPRKDQDWYKKQCETLDPVTVAQEIDRNYESSVTNAFITGDIVNAAAMRGPADVQANGGLRVGIDVARFGDDNTVITFRRGRVLLSQIVLSKLDVAQVAGRAKQEIDAYGETPEQIAVDTIGIGAGVADIMRGFYPDKINQSTGKKTEIVVDVNAAERMANGLDYNMRAFMWREMKEWLKNASIPNDQDLKSDLTALRYNFKGGELLLESKDNAKSRGVKSPDRGDSLALTFAKPTIVVPKTKVARVNTFTPLDSEVGY